jgi:hypothetical protein
MLMQIPRFLLVGTACDLYLRYIIKLLYFYPYFYNIISLNITILPNKKTMNQTTTPATQSFIQCWKASGASELANYQLFLTELCKLLGVEKP